MQWLDQAPPAPSLSVTTPEAEVRAAAARSETLILEFEAFRDGRGFSLAALLRQDGYKGRLIAAGAVLPDQVRHLARSGFDAVVLPPGADTAPWRRMQDAFSVVYQPAADAGRPAWLRRGSSSPEPTAADPAALEGLAARLNREAEGADAEGRLRIALDPARGLNVAALSSFGADAVVLLSLVARVAPSTPVLFLDTGMHFFQTLAYRKTVAERLGLTDVRLITPDAQERSEIDPSDVLWKTDTDACCDLRKVRPLARAAASFGAILTGRRRGQTAERAGMAAFEVFEGRIRVNPIFDWTAADVQAWIVRHDLPRHPLVEQGYPSIGCWPCTRAVEAGEDARAGRWSGEDKTECGIHMGGRTLVPG